jgi:hypothetical protein
VLLDACGSRSRAARPRALIAVARSRHVARAGRAQHHHAEKSRLSPSQRRYEADLDDMAKRKSAQEQMRALRASVLAKLASDDRARRRARHQREREPAKWERRQRVKRRLRWLLFAAVVVAAAVIALVSW